MFNRTPLFGLWRRPCQTRCLALIAARRPFDWQAVSPQTVMNPKSQIFLRITLHSSDGVCQGMACAPVLFCPIFVERDDRHAPLMGDTRRLCLVLLFVCLFFCLPEILSVWILVCSVGTQRLSPPPHSSSSLLPSSCVESVDISVVPQPCFISFCPLTFCLF